MKSASDLAARAQELIQQELDILLTQPESLPATRLLATLVAAGVLDVRIAFLSAGPGIFHDKLGVFQDGDGRRVSFVGSANETFAAWGLNHESFEVFCSWRGEAELLRTRRHADQFDRLWAGLEPGVQVETLATITKDRLLEFADYDIDHALLRARTSRSIVSDDRPLLPYQVAVLESWRKNNHRGIVSFATGAGKTLVALTAVKQWTEQGRPALILVPGRELHRQWIEEIRIAIPDAAPLLCGAGHGPSSWGSLLKHYSDSTSAKRRRIILATNATFSSQPFQSRLDHGKHLLVISDEMHRLGSQRNLSALERNSAGGRMGLSATHRRQFDEAGTTRLTTWFGDVLEPVIGIAEAILMGRLVPYDYVLHTLSLDEDELEQYEDLTTRIRRQSAIGSGAQDPTEYLKMLWMERARLMKQARGKVPRALQILQQEFRPHQRWLVYCDDVDQLSDVISGGLTAQLPVMEFHSSMKGDRDAVLRSLRLHGGIVVAIRCLDEGVDIPVCDRALILASSTVDREYIQRRGRVLRIADDKPSATIHDLLLVDHSGGVLARSEARRALEFARLARNPAARAHLQLCIALSPDVERSPGLVNNDLEDQVGGDDE